MSMKRTRRSFVRTCCSLGLAGLSTRLGQLGMVSAHAQAPSDYKALVCVFLFGGNDSNNLIVPIDSRYAAYQTMRGSVAITGTQLLPAGGSGYGFHPALTNIQRLFNAQRVAPVFNIGPLARPMSKQSVRNDLLPRNLFSHSDQTHQWQTSDPTGGATGWGGRVADKARAFNTGTLPAGVTLSGQPVFLSGRDTQGVSYSNPQSFGLMRFGDGTAMDARTAALQTLLTFDSGAKLVSAANGVLADTLRAAQEINAALNSAAGLPVPFPASSLGQQLAQVAQIMSVRSTLGMNRQIFFVGMGGFDNHENLLTAQQPLLATLDAALAAFMTTMDQRGMTNSVSVYTESEFNRTANANGNNGTDHAWGSHHLVLGGAVNGGYTYGTFPTHLLRGPDDLDSRGNWIPTTAIDQYAATMAAWFGVSDADLLQIFPNLANFAPQRLGFV
jgi:uncharacterized protein (DUF1501 family)